ncbi:MAG TPA: roadblock/LC7 domain-containing protein [Gemmatimonadaceae bacterium]|nr:roadblock/LC7 domain-containing protein [Gemmatimonadaceae bacterium]
MSDALYREVLRALARQRDVSGVLLVDARDGIPIASTLDVGIDGDAVAAVAAALYDRGRDAARAAGAPAADIVHVEAEHGALCAVGAGDFVLAAVAGPRANLALLRLALLRARRRLAA